MATTQLTKRFRPVSIGTEDYWEIKKGTSKVSAVDPGEPINHDDFGSHIGNPSLSTNKQSFRIDREFPESMGTINELRVHCRANPAIANAEIKLGVALTAGPTWVLSSAINIGTADFVNVSAALARPGGGGWTEADLRDTTFQFSVEPDSAAVPDIITATSIWVEVDYLPTDESGGAIPPEFPSRKLRRSRLPVGDFEAELRADAIDIDLITDFDVVHSQGPAAGGSGWTEDDPAILRCIKNDLDLNKMVARVRAINIRDYAAMFWHTGISPYTYRSDEQYPDGPAVLHPGATETFARASKGWVMDASNRIIELANNKKRIGPYGVVLEGGATNYIVNSAFFNGFTGWTQTNPTRMSLDGNTTLFEAAVAAGYGGTNQTAKLNYIDGAGGCNVKRNTSAAFNNGESVAVSVWHQDGNASFPPYVSIQNTTTTKYWNGSTWVAGWTWIALTGRTTWGRSVVVFPNDTSTSVLSVAVYAPNSPGSGDTYTYVGKVQAEWRPGGQEIATGPIPTYSAAVTRQGELWEYTNSIGRRTFPSEAGTVIMRVHWFFDGPISFAGTPPSDEKSGVGLMLCYHDANNWAYLNYQQVSISGLSSAPAIMFTIKAGGTMKTAVFETFNAVDGADNIIAARWTSAAGGELGLPSRTISTLVDGVKGTDEYHTADMTELDTPPGLAIGNGLAVSGGFGSTWEMPEPGIAVSHIEILPFALSDDEIKARP